MFDLDKIVSNISRFQKIEQKKRKEKGMKIPRTKIITDKAPTLEEMQKFVGGYIEVVYAPNGDQIVLDEEGRLKDKDINIVATEYWLGDRADDEFANIVGDALILKDKARLK
jgi:hypothetical protein